MARKVVGTGPLVPLVERLMEQAASHSSLVRAMGSGPDGTPDGDAWALLAAPLGRGFPASGSYAERHRRLSTWLRETPQRQEIATSVWEILVDRKAFLLYALVGHRPATKRRRRRSNVEYLTPTGWAPMRAMKKPRGNPKVTVMSRVRNAIHFIPVDKRDELLGASLLDLSLPVKAGAGRPKKNVSSSGDKFSRSKK